MKHTILKSFLLGIGLVALISCENESFSEDPTILNESVIKPTLNPASLQTTDEVIKSDEDQPFTEYWERTNDGVTSFSRTGNFNIDGQLVIDTKVRELNQRNFDNSIFITQRRGPNFIYFIKDGTTFALPIWKKEKNAPAYKWVGEWVVWRNFKYRAYTQREDSLIRSYNPSRPIPNNWIRLSSTATGGPTNQVGYIGWAVHLSSTGAHPTAPVPKDWIIYSSTPLTKTIRYLGIPEVGDKTFTLVANQTLPDGWQYTTVETTAIGLVVYTIEYHP